MIREVSTIPDGIGLPHDTYRKSVRSDLQEAIDKQICMFEFVGDYNYETLQGIAREEADKMIGDAVRKWKSEHPDFYETYHVCLQFKEAKTLDLIKITSVRDSARRRRRVFCQIKTDMQKEIQEYAEKRKAEAEQEK